MRIDTLFNLFVNNITLCHFHITVLHNLYGSVWFFSSPWNVALSSFTTHLPGESILGRKWKIFVTFPGKTPPNPHP